MDPSDFTSVFLHNDISRFIFLNGIDLRNFYHNPTYKSQILQSYYKNLKTLFPNGDIWVPTFNYSYCDKGVYNIQTSPSQVGVFSEFFRLSIAEWRTSVPIFSIAGIGVCPLGEPLQPIIDPFGRESMFAKLVSRRGALVNYDVHFSPTFIHYIERIHNDGPLYRYDKYFCGEIINNNSSEFVKLIYHVIPKGLKIVYDTNKVLQDLLENGIANLLPKGAGFLVDVEQMVRFCLAKLDDDPFYFLETECVPRVRAELDRTGRRFKIDDFLDSHRSFHP